MDVPGQYCRESRRQVRSTDDVRRGGEREVRRTNRRALYALVHAEKSHAGVRAAPPGGLDEVNELRAHFVAL
jgi:hypothetical protein